MTNRTLFHQIDRELRRKRVNGVPELRHLRRRRARRMAARVPAPIARPAPTAEQVQRAMASDWTIGDILRSARNRLRAEQALRAVAGPDWTLGEILQLALIRLPARA